MRTWRVISIIAENKLHAHHKTHLHTMKVYNTHDRSFANWVSFFSTTEVFTCSKVTLSSNKIHGLTCSRKALNLIFSKLSSQNMCGFGHAMILIPSFHGHCLKCLGPQPLQGVQFLFFPIFWAYFYFLLF